MLGVTNACDTGENPGVRPSTAWHRSCPLLGRGQKPAVKYRHFWIYLVLFIWNIVAFLFQRGNCFVGVLVIIFTHFTWNILKSVWYSNSKNSRCFERDVFHFAWICSSLKFSRKCAKPLKSFTAVCIISRVFLSSLSQMSREKAADKQHSELRLKPIVWTDLRLAP